MNKLNLEIFNDILFEALKDQSVEGQIKLLKAELNMIGDMLFSETAELLDELEQCGYESERFTRIKNIKNNSEGLLLKLEGLEKKLKETESDGEMNLLEHYIKEIHSVQDVSDKYERAIRQKPKEPLYEVDITVDCYGVVERTRKIMNKSEFEQAKKQGYFLA